MHHPQDITGAVTQGSGLDIAPITWFWILIGIMAVVATIYYMLKRGKE